MNRLRTRRASELHEESEKTPRWLIDELWSAQGVGIVGGEPKSYKSFLALDMAVAVAGGVPCLRRFAVPRPGRVLLYNAEDAAVVVRERLLGIARAAERTLEDLDLHVITEASLRLDRDHNCARLTATVRELQPQLLILDPFVRLHRVNENHSSEIAPMLAYLRDLQRTCNLAVVVVHHAKKGGGRGRAGQELRGSSEFHAWGDSNLYLRRRRDRLRLSVEHRAAPSHEGWELKLIEQNDGLALDVVSDPAPIDDDGQASPESPSLRVLRALGDAASPLTVLNLRKTCRMRTQTVSNALRELAYQGFAHRTSAGYSTTPDSLSRFLTQHSLKDAGKGNGKAGGEGPIVHHGS